MADMIQNLLSLQYSQNFEIQGIQEANVDLVLPLPRWLLQRSMAL